MTASPVRRRTPVDVAMAQLLHLLLAEDLSPEQAAPRLCEQVRDPRLLRQMAARVQRALLERPSELAGRTLQTIERAVGLVDGAESEPSPPRAAGWG
jgi:hypothetical protein